MMLAVVGIYRLVENPSADVLAELEIHINHDGENKCFWAEAKKCKHTEAQIDWADELAELISVCNAPETSHSKIDMAVFQTFIGEIVEFPIVLIAST